MIAIAIFGILIALGVPSYTVWLQNTQIRNAAESMQNGLLLARAEAVRSNIAVSFTLGTGSAWTVAQTATGTTLQSSPFSEGAKNIVVTPTPACATTVTFNGLGRLINNCDASITIAYDIQVPNTILPDSDQRKLRITIGNPGGSIRMCDPAVTDSGDPRKC